VQSVCEILLSEESTFEEPSYRLYANAQEIIKDLPFCVDGIIGRLLDTFEEERI